MFNAIFIIVITIVFGLLLSFANIHTFKNFKRDKDMFFLIFLISADIGYLFIYLPSGIVAIASLL